MKDSYFIYDMSAQFDSSVTLIGNIEEGIHDTKKLMSELQINLDFPQYFGRNWDALYDCLCDFTWTDKHSIVLRHKDLPNISHDNLLIYLGILRDAILNWRDWKDHEFIVVFPEVFKSEIESILL